MIRIITTMVCSVILVAGRLKSSDSEIKAAIEAKLNVANSRQALSDIATRQAEKMLRDPVYQVSRGYMVNKIAMEEKLRDAENCSK